MAEHKSIRPRRKYGRKFQNKSKKVAPDEDIDECLTENICGFHAGCVNTIGSYICLCPDLKPVDSNGNCNKERYLSKKKTDEVQSSFTAQKLHEIVHTYHSGNDTIHTKYGNQSLGFAKENSAKTTALLTSVMIPVAVVCCLFILTIAFVTYLRRRGGHFGEWMCWSVENENIGKSGLKMDGKHATNPNYYTIQDDISFIKQMQIFEIPRHKIAFISKIGEGYFGEVYKGSYMKECPDIGMLVAIKILKNNVNTEACSDFEREVETLSSFDHKNIVKLLGVVTQDTTEIPWMVFEYMRYGDLTEFLRQGSPTSIKNVYRLVQSDLLFIARQIASGMVYLSEQHFVHRDLATRNCLVGDGLSVKISDFGLSRDIYTCDYYKIGGSRMLPVRWMAPESVVYGKFTLQSDAWSFGVVLWEIFVYGKQPYYGHSNDQVVKMILQEILLDASEGCPPLISSIMKACWKIDPNDRLTFPEIYKLLSTNFNQIKKSGELLEIENYLVPDLHLSIN